MLAAELPLLATRWAKRGYSGASGLDASLRAGSDHALLGVLGAKLPLLATLSTKRGYGGTPRVGTLVGADDNHPLLSMPRAEFLLLASHNPIRRLRVTPLSVANRSLSLAITHVGHTIHTRNSRAAPYVSAPYVLMRTFRVSLQMTGHHAKKVATSQGNRRLLVAPQSYPTVFVFLACQHRLPPS